MNEKQNTMKTDQICRCYCGQSLPSVADSETPYEFCSDTCDEKALMMKTLKQVIRDWERICPHTTQEMPVIGIARAVIEAVES